MTVPIKQGHYMILTSREPKLEQELDAKYQRRHPGELVWDMRKLHQLKLEETPPTTTSDPTTTISEESVTSEVVAKPEPEETAEEPTEPLEEAPRKKTKKGKRKF